jgi:hypothetical protein
MKITHANLIRWAGLSALLAGLCYVFVGVFHPANAPASVTTTRWETVHVVACAMSFFGVLGLAGLYARQARKSGWLGLVGFVLLSLWMVLIMGFSFVEAFVLPHFATTTPSFIDAWMKMFNGGSTTFNLGALPTVWTLSAPSYIGRGLLFGIATFRAHILPRGAAVLLALGTVLAPVAGQLSLGWQPKVAIPTGLALAWLGYALMTDHEAAAVSLSSPLVPTTA